MHVFHELLFPCERIKIAFYKYTFFIDLSVVGLTGLWVPCLETATTLHMDVVSVTWFPETGKELPGSGGTPVMFPPSTHLDPSGNDPSRMLYI